MIGKRIALGTVQFGLDYGISNGQGQVAQDDVAKILTCARANGIGLLDSAEAYGSAETVLGEVGTKGFEVISKIGAFDPENAHLAMTFVARTGAMLSRIGVSDLYALMLHDCTHLLGPNGDSVWAALEAVKAQGLVHRIGVSTYHPEETLILANRYPLDIVQLPLSPLDNRWDLAALRGIEIHVRSVFLQGLMLMESTPDRLAQHASKLTAWRDWCAAQGISQLAACLATSGANPEVSKLVLGVTSDHELVEILNLGDVVLTVPDNLKTGDPSFLDPSQWSVS